MKHKLEIIVVLGGWLFKESDGSWRTMNFDELDGEGNASGDRVRVVAASFLSKKNPNLKIIVSGSRGRLIEEDCPTLAKVLKKELIDLAVKPENIIEEDRSTGTFGQLKESLAIVDQLGLSEIGIISNEYHLPRISEFLKYLKTDYDIKLISAEQVAIENDPEFWKKEVEDAYSSPEMQKRIALEQKGLKDLKEGKYKFS